MASILLSLLLSLQLLCVQFPASQPIPVPRDRTPQTQPLFWGMLDPELSVWFARLPQEASDSALHWDWSWRGFWAALFEQPLLKEVANDATAA